jgi:UDP-N-acetylmuramate dehydrogenase
MLMLENVSLKSHNTFGVEASTKWFCQIKSVDDLRSVIDDKRFTSNNRLLLGGGSNVLFTRNWNGLIAKIELLGREVVKEDDNFVWVKAGAGENWHQFVLWCLERNLAGLENLSLIPGNVGASPMQNIGAYGIEIKDTFESLEAVELSTGNLLTFNAKDCEFGYRESVFKRKYKNQFAITSVTYRLNKIPAVNTAYGAIEQELERMQIRELSIQAVSKAVINIRQSKLPDPKVLGNAGSFFKNPTISAEQFSELQKAFPEIPNYPAPNNQVKLAAGWLIEQCGWKGKRMGNCGMHEKQALVLVNYGDATGQEIYDHSTRVLEAVQQKFGVELEREVNII